MSRSRYMAMGAALAAVCAPLGFLVTAPGANAARTAPRSAGKTVVLRAAEVTVGSSKRLILVDSAGKPVYLLTGDSERHPLCESSDCLGNWPAVTTTLKTPRLGSGVKGKLTVWHHGHLNQVVLNGQPLYTFVGDSGGSSAAGQGLKSFGGTWKVLSSSGGALTTTKSSGSSGY